LQKIILYLPIQTTILAIFPNPHSFEGTTICGVYYFSIQN
jgi:hypothetical protein